jgi:hypothetical protein
MAYLEYGDNELENSCAAENCNSGGGFDLFGHDLGIAAPESLFAQPDGAKVYYTDYGGGENTLVFVHGWHGLAKN